MFEQVKDDMAYMLNTESDWVTSEGMSYGIMIAAQVGPFSCARYFSFLRRIPEGDSYF